MHEFLSSPVLQWSRQNFGSGGHSAKMHPSKTFFEKLRKFFKKFAQKFKKFSKIFSKQFNKILKHLRKVKTI